MIHYKRYTEWKKNTVMIIGLSMSGKLSGDQLRPTSTNYQAMGTIYIEFWIFQSEVTYRRTLYQQL